MTKKSMPLMYCLSLPTHWLLLNSEELVSLVHLPAESVRSVKLRQSLRLSCAAPPKVLNHKLVLGVNEHGGFLRAITLDAEQRAKHVHVLGASGTGKSLKTTSSPSSAASPPVGGDHMTSVLGNAILAFLESSRGDCRTCGGS
jgi:hypothetical protein